MEKRAFEELGQRIKRLREERGWSIGLLEMKSGVERTYLGRIESGKRPNPSAAKLAAIATAFGMSIDELYGRSPAPLPMRGPVRNQIDQAMVQAGDNLKRILDVLPIPVLGNVPFGGPLLEDEQAGEFITLDRDLAPAAKRPFALKGQGMSLEDAGIYDGDILIVDPDNKEPVDGDLVVARIEGEITAKYFYRDDHTVTLEPANSKYAAIKAADLEIVGVVLTVIKRSVRRRRA